ncbi:aminodeoxychorismate synthase component I [Tengunoibacter tsumagoiensis]|uniref:Aminodeoxychorismate synthase, component I n=1 Tax=Tengunoibacter tsumagoiensis TaxID=2014871 RepID=A0A401ZZT3_9CHLR|nr:aminodeoxychorismate synthase component I [Tengunoibacter tsumagoiensis]GCE12378.1 aminodeoxychorismate synthase, component I [Tengunoibacter tsumagoiensis]
MQYNQQSNGGINSTAPLADEWYKLLEEEKDVVLLESSLQDQENMSSFLFSNPIQILKIHRVAELSHLLLSIQMYVQQGYYVAGYFAYECGYALEKLGLADYSSEKKPLAWFGVYKQPLVLNHLSKTEPSLSFSHPTRKDAPYLVKDLHFNLDESAYHHKIEQIKEYIRAGDVYQVNFTGRYNFTFSGSPVSFYQALKKKQQVRYGGYIRTADQDILCFSPELFFRADGQKIITKPMKGTAPRGCTLAEDDEQAAWLYNDTKNRAENVMIVDLLRNDLGRICQIGSVTVPHLFEIEQYATLFQMTSTVQGRVREEIDYSQLFQSLFPCGSITGAPKMRAIEIIKELEDSPRGVYTGSIGYFAPRSLTSEAKAVFNVAIRTIVLEQGQGEMGVGSGITYDSQPADEYLECAIKARFLTTNASEFALLETILWDEGYCSLDKHLERMANSARYFGYPYHRKRIEDALANSEVHLVRGCRYKVRLKLFSTGQIEGETLPLQPETLSTSPRTIILSSIRTHSRNRMLYHKTTDRTLYDRATRFAKENGHVDMIFLNERDEVTEGAISNIFIEKDGHLFTPPIQCGLLNGIYRQRMLESHATIEEKVLFVNDLVEAEKIYICNAIRGLVHVQLQLQECKF